ncbi:MAG: class I tRNA ligase family protein, partial [Deltaproteobacteria bacterium]
EKVISQHGAEILRLWVASENYQYDIHCSDDLIKRCSEDYRKIRNTCRHILGNISDFNPKRDAVPYTELFEIDQYALLKLQRFIEKAKKGYEQYEFHGFFHALNNYCVIDLSAFYLDILKDRLYTYAEKSKERRSAQTALHEILLSMTQWMAPILPFTAEEVYQQIPGRREKSVHLADLPEIKKEYLNSNLEKRWEKLLELRQLVSKALEEARAKKTIGNALEAKVILHLPSEWRKITDSTMTDLSQLFIVSQVNKIAVDSGELKVEVAPADGQKCQRCWIWNSSVTENQPICEKCKRVLAEKV